MEVKRVGGIDERCLVILSDCPKCGNNEYIVPPKMRVFDKSIKIYYPKCSKCNTLYNGKTLEKNLIVQPVSLKSYRRIFEKGIYSYLGFYFSIIGFIGFGLYLYLSKFPLYLVGIISAVSVILLYLIIASIKSFVYNSNKCPSCKRVFEKLVYPLKTDDLFCYDKNYYVDQNNNIIKSRRRPSYLIFDIWNICESCKICQLSEMRLASNEPIENSEAIYSTNNMTKKNVAKNNISNESSYAKNKKKLGKNGRLTSLVKIIKNNTETIAIYADINILENLFCFLFATPFFAILLGITWKLFQKYILDFNINDTTIAIYALSISAIYWFLYEVFLRAKTFININDNFFVVRKEYYSLKFKKKVKVICSITIDNISQLYVDQESHSSGGGRGIGAQTTYSYHLKIKTKDKEEITLIENGKRFDLTKLEDYLEDYLEIEDVIVSDKEVLSK